MPGFKVIDDRESHHSVDSSRNGGVLIRQSAEGLRNSGSTVEEFGEAFPYRMGVAGVPAVTSGAAASLVAHDLLKLRPLEAVVVPLSAPIATVKTVMQAGGTPVCVRPWDRTLERVYQHPQSARRASLDSERDLSRCDASLTSAGERGYQPEEVPARVERVLESR